VSTSTTTTPGRLGLHPAARARACNTQRVIRRGRISRSTAITSRTGGGSRQQGRAEGCSRRRAIHWAWEMRRGAQLPTPRVWCREHRGNGHRPTGGRQRSRAGHSTFDQGEGHSLPGGLRHHPATSAGVQRGGAQLPIARGWCREHRGNGHRPTGGRRRARTRHRTTADQGGRRTSFPLAIGGRGGSRRREIGDSYSKSTLSARGGRGKEQTSATPERGST